MIERHMFLRDIATAHPCAINVLEDLHLDYCCHGARALDDACRDHGLDPDDVLEQLRALDREQATTTKQPHLMSTSELIDHIVDVHHTFTRSALATIAPLMDKVLRVHGDEHPELEHLARTVAALRVDLAPHLVKEENVLFPALRALARNEASPLPFPVQHPIDRMQIEHDAVAQLLVTLSELTNNYAPPSESCTSWRALYRILADLERDLHLHIHLENNVLFASLRA